MNAKEETRGEVYCPICTHIVEAQVLVSHNAARVKPGQKCPRCSAQLDAAHAVRIMQAA